MSNPFGKEYFAWALPLKVNGKRIVTVAIPPTNCVPFIMGSLESSLDILVSLVDSARIPGTDSLPVRLVMAPVDVINSE